MFVWGRRAAVKVLKQQVGNEDFRQFIDEVKILSNLRHPNIVRILDFGVEGDIPFIVMDYAPNGTLLERHPAGTLVPLETVIFYVNQVAAALQYMHNEKLVHRNVKPNAMLVGRNNEILLGSFGIVQSIDAEETFAAGTPRYIAPEQISGKSVPASDQYALAVVIYEWLAGKPLFEGTAMEVIFQHTIAAPSPLRNRIPLIPPAVELVLTKALAKNPEERFPSVIAFAQALAEGSYPMQNINPYSYGSAPANVSSRQTPALTTPSQQQYGSSPTYANSSYTPYPQTSQPQSEVAPSYLPPPPPQARRFSSFSWRGMLVGLIGLITIATVEVIANGGVAQLLQSHILLVGLVGLLAIAIVGVIAKTRFK